MLIPLLRFDFQKQQFQPLIQAEAAVMVSEASSAEIQDLLQQAGLGPCDMSGLIDLNAINGPDELFPLVDSQTCFIAVADSDSFDKYKYLFSYHILAKVDKISYADIFCKSQNELLFSGDCPGSVSRQSCKARVLAESEYYVLAGCCSPADFIQSRMAEGAADLHIHTTASDSSDTPEKVCRRVMEAGLRTFAITDHDNTEAAAAICGCLRSYLANGMKASDLPVYIPGTEISVQEERELHLLAYFPFGGFDRLQYFLQKQQNARDQRNLDMIATLQSLGYDISIDELNASGDHSVGRMQMALLLKARGYVKTTAQAFADLLGYGKPGYIERPRPGLKEAIFEIRIAGGVPVLAHPALYGWCRSPGKISTRQELLERFAKYRSWGLTGIESFHGEAEKNQQHLLSEIALELQMLRTGGSDDHGHNKSHTKLFDRNSSFY